jgi:AAA+ ATPase superfamily predicted ATPase
MFIAREEELNDLEKQTLSKRFEMPIIYGRRRIGKTFLIQEFIKDKRAIMYVATKSGERANLSRLAEAINAGGFQHKVYGELTTFEQGFDIICDIAKESSEPLIFVIDEYPYLAKSSESISSILQATIDHKFLQLPNLMMILAGSSMSFMEHQVLGYESPLYGRRTSQFKLKPFSYWEAHKLFPKMKNEEFLTLFALTGGVPLYLTMLQDGLGLEGNIKENFLRTNTFLLEEPDNFLKQELSDPTKYNDIIEAIATGSTKSNEVATKVGMSAQGLDFYIKNLIELGIIQKIQPIVGGNNKNIILKVVDGLFAFWYRFVPKYMTFIESGKRDIVWEMMQEDLRSFTAEAFEKMARDWLKLQNGSKLVETRMKEIGSWWGRDPLIKSSTAKQNEIDIVALGISREEILVGECKWKKESIDIEVVEQLLYRSQFFSQPNKEKIIFYKSSVDSKAKLKGDENEVKFVSFDNMQ